MSKYEHDKKHWPKDALKRSLLTNFPGAGSLQEALKNVIQNKAPPPLEATEEQKYNALRQVIKEIEILLKDYDINSLGMDTREKLALMPLTTIEQSYQWRDAWVQVLKEAGVKTSGASR